MDSGKNPMNNDKSLCLYCDKAFANLNDQENHVERDHKTILKSSRGKGSRKSERITKISTTELFPGCFYCNNRKLGSRSDDLESLFQHLMTAHNEVYYGCKCRVRMQDKVALVNHKKNCKIGGSGDVFDNDNYENEEEQDLLPLVEKVNKKAKTKKSQVVQCDSPSESEDTTHQYHHSRTNAINKKSENNNSNNNNSNSSRKSYYVKRKNNSKLPSSSSSTISSSSKASDEYTIPITRQKLKEPVIISSPQKNRTASNKKSSKASSSSSSTSSLVLTTENKNQQANALSSSTSSSSSSSLAGKVHRTKASKLLLNFQNNNTNGESNENSTSSSIAAVKNEIASCEFDEDFYKNISCNIRLNLDCFIDGKADRLQNKKFIIENGGGGGVNTEQMQNDTNNHQYQRLIDEKEIHEATNFELSPPPFPALLTTEQYGFGESNPNKNKRQFTKNSWKWRWDLIKKYKFVNEGGKRVKKVKQITTGLKDLSQLDMWTQLTMRSRHDKINEQHQLDNNLSMRMIKTQNLDQLNGILDSRLTPEIYIEQLQQMLVKEELVECDEVIDDFTGIECNEQKSDVLNTLQLESSSNNKELNPASLSGEWARPRCFMCIDCGQEFDLMKSLIDHKNSEHPYVVSAHYEVVGRENLEQKLYKNLFLPKKALNAIDSAMLINSDSKSNEASSSSQDSSNLADLREKECTKCRKIIKYSNDTDIYRHILDCIEDKVWMQAKKRSKYRRSRRKGKKNARKIPPRANIDQKKSTASPLMKETVEGENSTLSTSNPQTPVEDKVQLPSSISNNLKTKNENFINADEGINIKSFFRVSKTTPNLPQRMFVQMLQMPNSHNSHNNNNNNSHRHLRSSVKKLDENNKKSPQVSATESNGENDDKKDETINFNNDSKIEIENTRNQNMTLSPEQSSSPLVLTSLHVSTPEKCKSPLNSPTNSTTSSLVSPTSCSSVPKKKKKLNDCIAMLTCKIQEKMGVNFFNNVTECSPDESKLQGQQQPLIDNVSLSLPLPSPPLSLLSITPPPPPSPSTCLTNVPQSMTIITPVQYTYPVQDEVIDLSIKKSTALVEETPDIIQDESKTIEEVEPKMLCNEIKSQPKSQEEISQVEPSEDSDIIQSFKISIAREKIPDLDEIIEKQNVITVNNLKISESERKAFEEQKNRIMQILSKKTLKPKKLTVPPAKKIVKKTPVKKSLPLRKEAAKKTVKFSKTPTIIIEEQKNEPINVTPEEIKLVEEIEEEVKLDEVKELETIADKHDQVETSSEIVTKEPEVVKITKRGSAVKAKKSLKAQKFKPKSNSEIENMEPFILLEKIDTSIAKFSGTTNQKVLEEVIEVKPDSSNENVQSPTREKLDFPSKPSQKVSIPFPSIPSSTTEENELIQSKIEQAIKNTNRIRCRRLSVVVDPILHLPAFQKSRKIRLTNNSQQNGFYDLLANDQLFNALKNAPQLKNEIKKLEAKKTTISQAIKEVKAAVSKETSSKNKRSKRKASKYASGKVMKVTRKKKKSKPKIPEIAKEIEQKVSENSEETTDEIKKRDETIDPVNDHLKEIESSLEIDKNLTVPKAKKSVTIKEVPLTPTNIEKTPIKVSKPTPKKALLEHSSTPQKDQKEIPITPEAPLGKTKGSQKKEALAKKVTKKQKLDYTEDFPITANKNYKTAAEEKEEEKVAKKPIEIKSSAIKKAPPRKAKKTTKDNLVISEEKSSKLEVEIIDAKLSLDISLSSDTSNENDIPLAKLIAPKPSLIIEEDKEKVHNKKSPTKDNKSQKLSNQRIDDPKDDDNSFTMLFQQNSDTKNDDETKIAREKQKSQVQQKDTKSKKDLSNKKVFNKELSELKSKEISSSKSDSDKYEVFSINEDSFFNDDNDVDQANDKINALVNNIINSSELIDSENEKLIEGDKLNQETKCEICNKSFRNEKVLEKHFKTNTHLLKEKRKGKKDDKEVKITLQVQQNAIVADETKIFRTKGALKTFDNILSAPMKSDLKSFDDFKPIVEDSTSFVPIKLNDADDDDDDDDDEELSTKDKIFDSLFSNIENKLQAAAKNEPLPKFNFPKLSHHDSESSTASWDLKHDADIDWNTGTVESNLIQNFSANLAKNTMPISTPLVPLKTKVVKPKETAVSIPTKSLIMGKIFKKHRDREKQKTPQADAPNNKPGIKNSLDEIFDHLKNTAEIDDKVLTCPSPKTLLKNSTFSPQSSNSNDMLETASHSNKNKNVNNNNIYKSKSPLFISTPEKCKVKDLEKPKLKQKKKDAVIVDDGDMEEGDGIGKRKSSRRCAIKTKTFAETWSSDEYEELHDTNDIISIINEIEKRESIKKRKEANQNLNDSEVSSILKTSDSNKKKVQLHFPPTIKRRKMSTGHKSDDEKLKDHKTPLQKSQLSLKKRRMSCFVPSTAFKSENINAKSKNAAALIKTSPVLEQKIINPKSSANSGSNSSMASKVIGPGTNKNVLKNLNNTSNTSVSTTALQNTKKKAQKHRKRPRNKVKNIAYDSDSDYELNVSKKAKVAVSNAAYSDSESGDDQEEDSDYNDDEIESLSQVNNSAHKSEVTTMTKEPAKLLPNDLNAVINSKSTAISKAAIQQQLPQHNEDNSLESACNRTKRHSSEKLYYWSSSSDSETEQGDMADGGENEDSMIPQQPEQHGWIVGDSHKKLVTLLAHAKIKNKLN